MEKLKMHSINKVDENVAKIGKLFPNCVTERKNENGEVEYAVDFDMLRQELSSVVVEGNEERYQFTWPDKKKAILAANAPISATLRPCREESVDFDTTQNLYIEGDNLDVLKLLQETYLGKVKLIYIDPPYNTGHDFVYSDTFEEDAQGFLIASGQVDESGNRLVENTEGNGRFHTDWLNMMYSRLKLSRDLLSDDGVILISIDENEVDSLKKMGKEIFGESNYAGEIIWKNSSKNDQAYISIQHEYILFFVKNKNVNLGEWYERKEGIEEIEKAFADFRKIYGDDWEAIHKAANEWYKTFPASSPIYANKHYSWMDNRGIYFASDISGPHFGQYRYNVIHPVTGKVVKQPASGWRYPESTMKERIAQGFVHFGKDETTVPCNKTYLSDTIYQSVGSVKYKDGRAASKYLSGLMGINCFTNPKDVTFLQSLFETVGIKAGDTVLDFFSGSASSAEAVLNICEKLGNSVHFIMVQLPENLDESFPKAIGSSKQVIANAIVLCDALGVPHHLSEIGKERIRRAGKKIKEENPLTTQDLDIGFRVLKLDSSNMKDVYYTSDAYTRDMFDMLADNIKEDRTPEDLLFQVMLDLGIPLSAKIEESVIAGKKVFKVEGNYLIACFDSNLTEETITAIAQQRPYNFVMRDSSMANDSVATNFEQIFATYSPETDRKVL